MSCYPLQLSSWCEKTGACKLSRPSFPAGFMQSKLVASCRWDFNSFYDLLILTYYINSPILASAI